MQPIGILILTSPVRYILDSFGNHLAAASKHVSKVLYIKLEPGHDKLHPPLKRQVSDLNFLSKFIPALYSNASKSCNELDVRLLLTSFKNPTYVESHLTPMHIDLALTDSSDPPSSVKQYVNEQFQKPCLHVMKLCKAAETLKAYTSGDATTYETVILGGTFDRLHNGHKILLSTAVSRATKKIIVGITDGAMLKRKQLWELIEPLEKRIRHVDDFLKDIDPTLERSIVPIYDPFGPAIEDCDIDCIVVSSETSLGGEKVNEERLKRNMKKLDVLVVGLLEDPCHTIGNELKISSSNHRKMLLGTFMRKSVSKSLNIPLRIILTGGPASGKSSVCSCLKLLGVPIIDTYDILVSVLKSPEICQDICKLGCGIFEPNQEIDMNKLYLLSLKDQAKRQAIKKILFPAVSHFVHKKVKQCAKTTKGSAIIVKEAALFKGDWQYYFIHTWISLLPEAQRIQKLKSSCGMSEEEAVQALSMQPPSSEFVDQAHVVFSPQWSQQDTMKQVEKAYEQLKILTVSS